VRQRTAQLETINRELESFSYSVSHDLRAPLRHLSGFVSLLKDRYLPELDEKGRQYLKVIGDSALKMNRLIDDILSFSRMGRIEMLSKRVNLETLFKEALDTIQGDLKGREIEWRNGDLPEAQADPALLRTVLINLVSNAVKFTGRKERAVIEIGHIPDQADEEVFYIKDNGAGFDMKYKGKLFGLFQRLHREEDFEGTGLGLANVQRIISRHGGRVWAEGVVGEGATFYFSLPKKSDHRP
jgi:light-regulated signal transduction histidine kinase (bacteriophytochrome)